MTSQGEFPDELEPDDPGEFKEENFSEEDLRKTRSNDTPQLSDPEIQATGQQFAVGEKLGRYEVKSVVGKGGFGTVYHAWDPRLERDVAIKVARTDRLTDPRIWKNFVDEGRAIANLSHDALIQVYDVERLDDNTPYVVMEFIRGQTLREFARNNDLTIQQSLLFVREIALGLRYAHSKSIVHRDLKPSNIIIDENDRVRIADFGLALNLDSPMRHSNKVAGTAAYMAPEQVRAENHRLDGRTDIWALGVIMYWLFANRRPFSGNSFKELSKEICQREPIPIRQYNDGLPREIDRICGRCLSKLMSERYPTAGDLIDDLELLLVDLNQASHASVEMSSVITDTPSQETSATDSGQPTSVASNTQRVEEETIKIVPKGLRSYRSGDADFFLELLPGPKDRDGIPNSIRFWLNSMRDPDQNLPVGLIYGPSGCGKTSFMRAGLLPRLSANFDYIYCEATGDRLEEDLCKRIHDKYPLAGRHELEQQLHDLRLGKFSGSGKRLLVVIDQFEQWLHSNSVDSTTMINALRQADGDRVQFILLVRDDYWMPIQEIFNRLEVEIQDGRNSQALPLFDIHHGKRILASFGRVLGRFPDDGQPLSSAHKSFVDAAVDAIQSRDKIICGHLALFAEMMKSNDWTVSELNNAGGWQGIGFRFLETEFGEETAPRSIARHLQEIREVLTALLPPMGEKIKGARVSVNELLERCPGIRDFKQLNPVITILESDYRLITRTIEELNSPDDLANQDSLQKEDRFQFAHDLLVEPVRDWLNHKQKQTWQGRAAIRLSEFTEHRRLNPKSEYRPTAFDYARIKLGVPDAKIDSVGKNILRETRNRIAIRLTTSAVILAGLIFAFVNVWQSSGRQIALDNQLAKFLDMDTSTSEDELDFFEQYKDLLQDKLAAHTPTTPRGRIRKAMLELRFGIDTEPNELVGERERLRELLRFLPVANKSEFDFAVRLVGSVATRKNLDRAMNDLLTVNPSPILRARLAIFYACVAPDQDSEQKNFKHVIDTFTGNPPKKNLTDATNRNVLISEFGEFYSGPPEDLLGLLASLNPPFLKANSIFLLAQLSPEDWSSETKRKVVKQLRTLYQTNPASQIHSACKYALRRFGENLPSDLNTTVQGTSWFEKEGITFVRINEGRVIPGQGDASNSVQKDLKLNVLEVKPFWISDSEITKNLFQQFINSNREQKWSFNPDVIPNPDCPATSMTIFQAAEFCNWLSKKHGLEPAMILEPFIPKAGDDHRATRRIRIAPEADGYRLPSVEELEYACRGGTMTHSHVGRFDIGLGIMKHFAHVDNPNRQLQSIATRLPNQWGVFDTLGNASEFCLDTNDPGLGIRHRGRSVESPPANCSSSFFDHWGVGSFELYGFRIALPIKQ